MKFSVNTVKQWVKGLKDVTAEEIAEKLHYALAEVEGIEYVGEKYKGLVVAKVLEIKKHPKAERLFVARVKIGSKRIVTVVTAASNLKGGELVPYTPVGVKVPVNPYPDKWDGIIRPKEFRGIVSEGMLNSELELGLGKDHDGIMILDDLPEDTVGKPLEEVLDLDDYLIEIENKALTHRGDLFSHIGMAQEIAALFNLQFVPPKWWYRMDLKLSSPAHVRIGVLEDTWRYSALVFERKNRPSPLWLKVFLSKFGYVPKNFIVDITNYVMLLAGQPIHAFDLRKLQEVTGTREIKLGVRYSRKGERLTLLDGRELTFEDRAALLIVANDNPVALAGIMGGQDAAVDEATDSVVFEIATFRNIPIRRGMMRTGVFTDAGLIFSRQQDPYKVEGVVNYLLEVFRSPKAKLADKFVRKPKPVKVDIDLKSLSGFIAIPVSHDDVMRLQALGFRVQKQDEKYGIYVPSYRFDVSIPEDIAEEIVRLKGYDNVQKSLPTKELESRGYTQDVEKQFRVIQRLVARGVVNVVNYSFMAQEDLELVGFEPTRLYRITNAISPDAQYVRNSLLPGLIRNLRANIDKKYHFALFEVGKVSSKVFGIREELPVEKWHLGLILWDRSQRFGFYTVKQLLSDLLPGNVEWVRVDQGQNVDDYWYEIARLFKPVRSAYVVWEGKLVGIVGSITSRVLDKLDLLKRGEVWAAELDMAYVSADITARVGQVFPYPPVIQDMCFIVGREVSVAAVMKEMTVALGNVEKSYGERLVADFEIIDIYFPPENQEEKHVTFRFYFVSRQRMIEESSLISMREAIVKHLQKSIGARLKTI